MSLGPSAHANSSSSSSAPGVFSSTSTIHFHSHSPRSSRLLLRTASCSFFSSSIFVVSSTTSGVALERKPEEPRRFSSPRTSFSSLVNCLVRRFLSLTGSTRASKGRSASTVSEITKCAALVIAESGTEPNESFASSMRPRRATISFSASRLARSALSPSTVTWAAIFFAGSTWYSARALRTPRTRAWRVVNWATASISRGKAWSSSSIFGHGAIMIESWVRGSCCQSASVTNGMNGWRRRKQVSKT
mmetsp:Transcript_21638/g.62992  ORF Transcript_21638/g.62992 Transcript_21638/m.62992 type:complete len:247 (+) Transcript_21638:18-758(+)